MKTYCALIFGICLVGSFANTGPVPIRRPADTLTGTISQRQQTYWSDRQPTLGGVEGKPESIGRVVDETVLEVTWKGEKRVFVLEGVLNKTIAH